VRVRPGVQQVTLTPSQWMATGTGTVRAGGYGTFACDVVQIDARAFPDGGRVRVGVQFGKGEASANAALYPENVTIIPPAKAPDRVLAQTHDVPPGWTGGVSHEFGPADGHVFQLCVNGSWNTERGKANTYAYRVAVDPVEPMANLSTPRPFAPAAGAEVASVAAVRLTPAARSATGTRSFRAAGYGTLACDVLQIDTRAFAAGGKLMVGLQLGDGEAAANMILYPEQVTVLTPSPFPERPLDQTHDQSPGWVGGLSHEFGPRKAQVYQVCTTASWNARPGATNTYTYQVTVDPLKPPSARGTN
jgi:hypothetical protein